MDTAAIIRSEKDASTPARFARAAGPATSIAGLVIIGLGIAYAVHPPAGDPGTPWLMLSAGAASLAALGVSALVIAGRAARVAQRLSAAGLALFAAAHLVAIGNADLGILLFSIFAVVAGIGLTVAGTAVLRAGMWHGWRRGTLLACGLPPITAIPLGAAIGDIPHFSAIAAWGICWFLLGVAVNRRMMSTGAIR